jgi:thioesterase domain-containing protein
VLARQAAINAVKSELQRRGERVASVAMRDIRIQADAYLAAHPELIDETRDRAERLGIFERKSRRWAVASSC